MLKRALILVVGFLGVIFDTTIVSVALHTLATQLHTSVSTIQWVTTGYLLALGIAVPLSAWGLQRFGGKRLWMFGLAVFLVGSIGSSLAWNVGSLIAWRVVQGVGGGILFPLLTTLIMQAAGGKALGRTVTIIALPALLGPILGPLVGGAILTHFSWRFMFWVNVPFCAVGLFLAARYIPADSPDPAKPRPHLDLPGLAMLAPGIAAVILGLSNAGVAAGFAHPDVIVPLAIGVVLLAAFTGYALRRTAPLVDVRLLARRPVASASAVLFFSGFSLYGAMLLLPLYYQEVRGYSPLTAGIMLAPQGVGALLSRNLAGRLTDKIGGRPIAVAGFVIVAASTIPFAFAGTSTNSWLLVVLAGRPRLRARRGHDPRDGGRLPGPGQAADRPVQRADPDSPADRRLVRHRGASGHPVQRHSRPPRKPRHRVRHRVLVGHRVLRPRSAALAVAPRLPAVPPAGPGQHATAHPGHQWPVHILTDGTWR